MGRCTGSIVSLTLKKGSQKFLQALDKLCRDGKSAELGPLDLAHLRKLYVIDSKLSIPSRRLQIVEQVAEIESSPLLGTYTPEHAKRLLKGDWRIDWSWTDEAVRAGFSKKYFQNVYSHFCGYAHSSYISPTQLGEAQPIEDQRIHGLVALQTCTHMMARAVSFYAELSPTIVPLSTSLPSMASRGLIWIIYSTSNPIIVKKAFVICARLGKANFVFLDLCNSPTFQRLKLVGQRSQCV